MIRFLALGSLLLLPGCLSTPDLTALANDPSAVCIRVTTIYGTIETSRNHGCEPGFQHSEAVITPLDAAQLCARAYSEPATIEAGDAHVLLTVIDDIVYPAFRGSATRLDWYFDFGAIPTRGIYGAADLGDVHPMFFADGCAVFSLIIAAANGAPIHPVGHSKGGGDAEMLAGLLADLYPAQLAGYTTFGKPKTSAVGNDRLPKLLYGRPGADYRHNRDIVPLVPEGFQHVRPTVVIGRRPWIADINPIGDHLMAGTIAALTQSA